MSQPVAYVPATYFRSYQGAQPWFPGQNIDIELDSLQETTDQIRANLALIQRDDGALKNGVVTFAALSPTLQTAGLAPFSVWATATRYAESQSVIHGVVVYRCAVGHTSTNFASNLAAGYWTVLVDFGATLATVGAPLIVGSNPTAYAALNVGGTDSNPSLTHNSAVTAAFNGTGSAAALVIGIATTSPNPVWLQGRSWFSDQTITMLLQPAGGGLAINTTIAGLAAGLTNGVQISDNWTSDSTYAPAGSANALGALNVYGATPTGLQGIVAFARTLGNGPGATGQALTGYAFADNASARGGWALYGASYRLTAAEYAYGFEIAAVNRHATVNTVSPFGTSSNALVIGGQITAGDSAASTVNTQYSVSAGLAFTLNAGTGQTNLKGFGVGIVFRSDSLDNTIYNPPQAISLAAGSIHHAIAFWADGSTVGWNLYSTSTTGTNTFVLANSGVDVSGYVAGTVLKATATSAQIVLQSNGVTGTISWTPSSTNKTITLPNGTTDFSATGGTAQVLKQLTAGGAFTVATIAASEIASGAALTKTDDTNVTLTLGGAASTALLAAASLTLGWTGTLALSRLAQGTDGQLIVGQTSASPLYKTISGDWTMSAAGAATLATVNSNVGTFGSATKASIVTVNAKGLVTAASESTVTPAVGSLTGLGTGVATALAVNVGSAGAFVTFNGALGTPSSGTATNLTGLPVSSGISGLGTGVATALAVNIGSAGAFVTFNGALGTPSSGTATNLTGLPVSSGISGLGTGAATALAVNVGTDGAFVVKGGALGSPSSAGTMPAFTLGGSISGGGQTITNLASVALRDTSAAFDLTIVATSAAALTAGRTLTLDMGNVAHTLKFGTTANTITFPNVASDTVGLLGATQTWSAVNTFSNSTDASSYTVAGLVGSGGLALAKSLWTNGGIGVQVAPSAGYVDVAVGYKVNAVVGLQISPPFTLLCCGATGANLYLGDSSDLGFYFRGGNITHTTSIHFQDISGNQIGALDYLGNLSFIASIKSSGATSGIGYATGAGGAVTQTGSRTTTVILNTVVGAITLVSAAGSGTFATFTVTNSAVAATDVIKVSQKSGTDKYQIFVTAVGAGSFNITFATTGGTTTEQPVFNFAVIKGVAS